MSAIEKLKAGLPMLGTYASPSDFEDLDVHERSELGITTIRLMAVENMGERRWGFDQQTVLDVDGELVGIWCYVTTGDGEQDEPSSWEFYNVQAKPTIEYVRVREPKVEKPASESDLAFPF